MNNQNIIEKMNQMRFHGMSCAFESTMDKRNDQTYTPDELVGYLIESEWDDRQTRRLERLVKTARFRYKAAIEQVRYDPGRNIEKNTIHRYASCEFISKRENILITGSTGVGKSFICSALGHQGCQEGFKVMYFNASKIFSRLKMSRADGSYIKEIDRIAKQDLIIIDDFGLQPMDNQSRLIFLEIIEDRHDQRSTIITSQLPVSKWYDVIGEKTVADALLDRLVHTSHRIEIKGESLRKRTKNN